MRLHISIVAEKLKQNSAGWDLLCSLCEQINTFAGSYEWITFRRLLRGWF